MGAPTPDSHANRTAQGPTVTIVFLVYNRRDELRTSLRKMLAESDYDPELVDVIVVDNASTDGSSEMVGKEFPDVRLIVRDGNIGVSGWNDGFAAAHGDWVLALDDDCYLPPNGLSRALAAAREHEADLVSFRVVSTTDPQHVFTDKYRTGLLLFWGCAVLIRRPVLRELKGYDPEIFVWANELEFMLRFFDRGYRHLHLPGVVAQHMKAPNRAGAPWIEEKGYRVNARHWGYIAAKLLRPRDSAEALVALVAQSVRDALRMDPVALKAVPDTCRGFLHGLHHRQPLTNPRLSRFYRRNFETFASPWWVSRPIREIIRSLPREVMCGAYRRDDRPLGVGRWDDFFEERPDAYPEEPAVLQF